MTATQRSALRRFLHAAWNIVDGARKLLLNLIFLSIVVVVLVILADAGKVLVVQPDTALLLNPYGNIVEQYSGSPLDQILQQATEEGPRETRLRDLVEAIRRAKNDEHIVRLVINPNNLLGVGMASLIELEAAIADFRTSGKPVVALADNLSQQQYFLAAMADEIWLQPKGLVWIDGFSAYRNFFHEGIDKLEVEVNLFRVGEYKSAVEPFIRDDMSAEDRESNLYWLGSLWQQYLESISRQRGLPLVDLSNAINHFADRLAAAGGDFSRLALEIGLIDRVLTRSEADQELAGLGAPGKGQAGFRHVGFLDYLAQTRLKLRPSHANKVAVVVVEGDILRGHQPPGRVGAETLAERLSAVAEDDHVKAVVVRINSPGGEVFASEQIRLELQALKDSGRTVVVSMGDVAASGGYWIAMAADEIWASPATLTGSIGVFGLLPTFQRPLRNLGIHTDGVGTTPLAGKLRLDLPLDADLKRIFQRSTEHTYQEFLEVVAAARGMSVAAVDTVARGRVWSGQQAKERGLVDQLGTLRQATDSAARIAGLGSDYQLEYSEPALSPLESLLLDLAGASVSRVGLASTPPDWMRNTLVEQLLDDLRLFTARGNGLTLAAHCLCRAPY